MTKTKLDPSEYSENELPIWPYIKQGDTDPLWWEKDNKPTDGEVGRHCLHLVEFVNAQFTLEANHGLRKDFESKMTLFPFFDSATIGMSIEKDKLDNREYDTLEDCVMEIEELKSELTTIIHDQTTGGRDKWNTPEVKKPGGRIGRLKKDRYSALVIANMVARTLEHKLEGTPYVARGGYVGQKYSGGGGRLYVGPEHIVSQMTGVYGRGVNRR